MGKLYAHFMRVLTRHRTDTKKVGRIDACFLFLLCRYYFSLARVPTAFPLISGIRQSYYSETWRSDPGSLSPSASLRRFSLYVRTRTV